MDGIPGKLFLKVMAGVLELHAMLLVRPFWKDAETPDGQHNLPPVVIKSDDKRSYLFALNQADSGDLNAFVEYICDQSLSTLNLSIKAGKIGLGLIFDEFKYNGVQPFSVRQNILVGFGERTYRLVRSGHEAFANRGITYPFNPAIIFTVSATTNVFSKNASNPCKSARRLILRALISTSDTWNVIPITNAK